MEEISAEFLLACLLSCKSSISSRDIKRATNEVYSALEGRGQRIFVNSCRDSIIGAVQGSPDVFTMEEGIFTRTRDHDPDYFDKDFIRRYLGRDLSPDISFVAYDVLSRAA